MRPPVKPLLFGGLSPHYFFRFYFSIVLTLESLSTLMQWVLLVHDNIWRVCMENLEDEGFVTTDWYCMCS